MIALKARSTSMLLFLSCAAHQVAPATPLPATEKPAEPKATSAAPVAPSASAAPAPVESMTEEEGVIAEGEACLSCHSAELVRSARIGEAVWKAEIVKMRNWGAPLDEDKAASFAAWFAHHYPASEPLPRPAVTTTKEAIAAVAPEASARAIRGDKQAGAERYAKDCASCHGPGAEGTGGGPVLIEAPVLYQPNRFAGLTKEGKGRMPAFKDLGRDDFNNLLVYLRDLR